MTDQKTRWAAKSERRAAWADSAEAEARAILASHEQFRGDVAFNTQPGHIPARARMIAQEQRAHELLARAELHRSKAASLERMANTQRGDAERARQGERDQLTICAGQTVQTTFYGPREVVRVNRKTLSIRDSFGGTMTIDKAYCRAM